MRKVQWINANNGWHSSEPREISTFGKSVNSALTLSRNGHFNLSSVRRLLANAPICKEELPAHGYLLAKLLFKVGDHIDSRYVLSDAKLLATYCQAIINIGPGHRLDIFIPNQGNFLKEALTLSNTYSDEDPSRQGLEFIRVYMRMVLQENSKLGKSNFAVSSNVQSGYRRGIRTWAPCTVRHGIFINYGSNKTHAFLP